MDYDDRSERAAAQRHSDSPSVRLAALLLCALVASGCAPTWPNLRTGLARPEAPGARSGDLAVIVAIEDYQHLADVPGAVANAEALAAWFRESHGLRPTRVRIVRDADATADRIRSTLTHAVGEVRPGQRLWFVFIGHGMSRREEVDGRASTLGMLVAADAPTDAMRLVRTGVLFRDVARLLEPVEHVALIDACFSGADRQGEPLVEGLQPVVWSEAGMEPGSNSGRGVTITAASGLEFAGQLPKGEVPAFSYLTLGALRGWADLDHDGRITALELQTWVAEALQTLDGREQRPQVFGRGDLVLGEGHESAPELQSIRRPEPAGPWLLALVSVAALAGGLTAYALNQEAYEEFRAQPSDRYRSNYEAARERVVDLGWWTYGGYALAGVAAVGAIGWRIALEF